MSYQPYSNNQKIALAKAYGNNQAIVIRLKKSQLKGTDEMMLTKTQIYQINKSKNNNKGLDLKISKSQIRQSIKKGGSLFSSLASLVPKLIPLATKLGSKILPGLASGILGSLGNFGMDKILGKGVQNRPRISGSNPYFRILNNNLPQLNPVLNLLTKAQLNEYKKAMKIGSGLNIKLNRSQQQNGGFLGILASIAIPLIVDALTKGNGLQNRPAYKQIHQPYNTPFFGDGYKTKKKLKKKAGKGILLGPNSPLKNIPILGAIF